MKYEDFELRIGPQVTGGVDVYVVQSPAGSGGVTAQLPKDIGGLESPGRPAVRRSPREVGHDLFRALFIGKVATLFHESLGLIRSSARECGLRICLRIEPPFQSLPWELMYRRETKDFLSLSPWTPVIRSLDVSRPLPSPQIVRPLRILAVSSQQEGGSLKLNEELKRMARVLGENPSIQLYREENPGLASLWKVLNEQSFHVLHFLGHGMFDSDSGEGFLQFFQRGGSREFISGQDFATTIQTFTSLRLVVLNACSTARSDIGTTGDRFAGVASALVLGGVPAVLGMQSLIDDSDAIDFSEAFYGQLAKGLSVEEATTTGRQSICAKKQKTTDWAIPVLFCRLPAGNLFKIEEEHNQPSVTRTFRTEFTDITTVQTRFENDLAPEQLEASYFSDSEDVHVRHCPILFRKASGAFQSVVSIDRIAEVLRRNGEDPLVLTVDFAPDLKETLWALASKLARAGDAGQNGLVTRWIRGTDVLSKLRLDTRQGRRAELPILQELSGQELASERAQAEQLDCILSDKPHLFIADFSGVGRDNLVTPRGDEAIGFALGALEHFARVTSLRGHRTLIGLPRLLLASAPAWRFVEGSDLSYSSAELFSPGQDFRVRRLQEKLSVEWQEPLRTLLACNSNALGYAVLAFLIEQGSPGWTPTSEAEWLALSTRLFRRGFPEIAYRLQVHRRKRPPEKELLALSFDVKRAQEPGVATVMGVVDDLADLPRSVKWGALVGEGGSGKTTTLKEIERKWVLPIVADEGQRRPSWLPVYLSVGTSAGSLWQRLAMLWREEAADSADCGGLAWEELAEWAASGRLPYVFASPLMLLVDGLDEVPPEEASLLSNELAGLRSRCGILAATRNDGHLGHAPGFDLIKLRALAGKQIERRLSQKGQLRLLELLSWKDRPVSGFLRNPFLLRCLCELDLKKTDVGEISEGALLEQWLVFKRMSSGVGAEEWERASRNLAMLALDWAQRKASSGTLGAKTWNWLDTARHIGVIAERRSGKRSRVRFAHAKLQVYFVAQALRQAWREPRDGPALDEWMWEGKEESPLPLLMGLLDPDERSELLAFVEERSVSHSLSCLRALPRKVALALPGAEKILRRQLVALDAAPPPKRAEMLVDLGPLDLRIESGEAAAGFGHQLRVSGLAYRLGKYPVTNLEFAHFIEEGGYEKSTYWAALERTKGTGPRLRRPKYWLSEGHDGPNAPVVGVCAFEALAYCEWLNATPEATRNGKYRFALPTVDQWLWAAHGADPKVGAILGRTHKKLVRAARRGGRDGFDPTPELTELRRRIEILAPLLEYQELLGPVGLTGHEASGCSDLYGGIWEWCDEWIVEVDGRDRPSQAPEHHPTYVLGGPSTGPFDPTFVLAGGWFDPFLRFERIGFRIARIEGKGDEP